MIGRHLGAIALSLLSLASTAVAPDLRLESVKQHALALYTLSLAQRRQFSDHAMVLLAASPQAGTLQRVQVWIDGALWTDYGYRPFESALLAGGASHQLGIVPLPEGAHEIRVEARLTAGGSAPARTVAAEERLMFKDWPLGLYIALTPQGTLRLATTIGGELLLRAADFERHSGRPGKAITVLQNLAHVDPALARQPEFAERMGASLAAWGLDAAAEATFAQLLTSSATTSQRREAGLMAAEIALTRGESAQAARYLQQVPGGDSPRRQLLGARSLLGQGALEESRLRMPGDDAELWRYNLAAALVSAGRSAEGEALLQELSQSAGADPEAAEVRDLASLQLAYRQLDRGEAQSAFVTLGRISADSHLANAGLLRRGWAALASIADDRPLAVAADGPRPRFARRIDAALQDETLERSRRITALRSALAEWLPLHDRDPQDPAVQEVLVAVPYALAGLGARERAIEYAELAVVRLEALREGLRRDLAQARTSKLLDAGQLAATAWPPQPGSWPFRGNLQPWWVQETPVVPPLQALPRLTQAPEFISTVKAMSTLVDVEAMLRGAAQVPNLKLRSDRQLESLAAERQRQQAVLDRFVLRWLRGEFSRATRYLVLARFTLAQLLEQEPVDAP